MENIPALSGILPFVTFTFENVGMSFKTGSTVILQNPSDIILATLV